MKKRKSYGPNAGYAEIYEFKYCFGYGLGKFWWSRTTVETIEFVKTTKKINKKKTGLESICFCCFQMNGV